MRPLWAIVGGLAIGGAIAWWSMRELPEAQRGRQQRAERAAAANARDARPSLYRWRDADGALHIADTPPKGHRYERIDRDAPPGLQVDGARQ